MPNELFSRDLKAPETLVVSTKQKIVSFLIGNGNVKANYVETKLLPDGTELTSRSFAIDASISDLGIDDLILQLCDNAEQVRTANEAAVAKDAAARDAEAARWAALTPDEQAAESAAALQQRQAATEAALASIDPAQLVSSAQSRVSVSQATP